MKVICREVDKNSGGIAVYCLNREVTDDLLNILRLRSSLNSELMYYVMPKTHYEKSRNSIIGILGSKNVDAEIKDFSWIMQI